MSATTGKLVRSATALPAITALSLGVLYGLGALFKAAELGRAGFAVRDTLPLVPLSQLLTRGIAVVWDNIVGILLLVGGFVVMAMYFRWVEARVAPADERLRAFSARLGALKQTFYEHGDPDEALRALRDEQAAISAELEAAGPGAATEEEIRRAEALSERVDAMSAHQARLLTELDEIESEEPALKEMIGRAGWPLRGPWWVAAVMAVLAPVTILLATPAMAVGLWAPFLGSVAWSLRGRRIPMYPHYLGYIVASVILAQLASAVIAPLPLAHVVLVERSGKIVSGPLIASTSDMWYVGEKRGNFVAVRVPDVRESVVAPSGRHRARLIYQYIWG